MLIDVPAGGSFADMLALKNDREIGDMINKLVARLADANETLNGAINVADFNDEEKLGKGKEMVDRLTRLVGIFEGLDFGRNRAEGDDPLGDAEEVSRVMAHETLHYDAWMIRNRRLEGGAGRRARRRRRLAGRG